MTVQSQVWHPKMSPPKMSPPRNNYRRARHFRPVDVIDVLDAELLEQVGRQDHEALALLYDRYSRLVFSIGLQVLQNGSEAEEMTQDVFVSVWRGADSYEVTRGKVSA
jgi:hypothetical protein